MSEGIAQYMKWTYPGHAKGLVFELLAYIQGMTDEQKVENIRAFCSVSDTKRNAIKALFDCLLHPDVVFDLPAGIPDFRHGNMDPDRSPVSLLKASRKLYYFLTNSELKVANDVKRDKIFVGILESLPLGDAMVLCAVKDLDYRKLDLSPEVCLSVHPEWYQGVETKTAPLASRFGLDLSLPLLSEKRGRGRPKGSKNKDLKIRAAIP